MKKVIVVLSLVLISAIPALAGNTTTITAAKIYNDLSATPLASGFACFTPVNQNGQPQGFTAGGGGQVLAQQVCFPVTSGALGTVVVPDTSAIAPAGIGYQVQIQNSNHIPLMNLPTPIYPTGSTWSLDSWTPAVSIPAAAVGIQYQVSTPTGSCSAPGIVYTASATYECVSGAWVVLSAGSGSFSPTGDLGGTSSNTIVQGINGVTLSSIANGLYKWTAGVPSHAVPGTDFVVPSGSLGTPTSVVLTNATGLPLSTGVTGNLAVTNLNNGTGATSSTFWRGDGTWATPSGSGSGTVTTFSAGNLSPLFTASVANPTSTPALSFALSNAANGTLFGNFTGASAAPSYNAMPASAPALGTNANGFPVALTSTGSGNIVLATAPALTTPNLGTPSAVTLTNATGLPLATGVTGNLSVNNLNGGTSASSSTFWRGDGTWASPSGSGNTTSTSLTSGTIPKANGANSIVNSLLTDSGTALAYTGTSGFTAPALSTSGSANGSLNLSYSGTAATAPGTSTFQLSPAVNVTTPWSLSPAAAPSSGFLFGTNTSGVVQQSFVAAGTVYGTCAGCATPSGSSLTGATGQGVYFSAANTAAATSAFTYTGATAGSPVGMNNTSPLVTFDFVGVKNHVGVGPATNATLSAAATSSQNTLSVASTTGYPATGGYLYVGGNFGSGEFMSYTGTTSTSFTGVTRGVFASTAQAQSSGASVLLANDIQSDSLSTVPKRIALFNGPTIYGPQTSFGSSLSYAAGTTQAATIFGSGLSTPLVTFLGGAGNQTFGNDNHSGLIFGGGNLAELNSAGVLTTYGNSVYLTTATSIAATTFTSTGLVLPAMTTANSTMSANPIVHGRCTIIWEQATAVSTVQFGIGDSNAPTSLYVMSTLSSGASGGTHSDQYTTITTATTTAISATGAPGAINTAYRESIDFTLTPGASSNVLTIYALSGSASDAVLIEPGSTCGWLL